MVKKNFLKVSGCHCQGRETNFLFDRVSQNGKFSGRYNNNNLEKQYKQKKQVNF